MTDAKNGVTRREVLKAAAAAGIAMTTGPPRARAMPGGPNPIELENANPGTQDWLLTNTLTDPTPIGLINLTSGRSQTIEGCDITNRSGRVFSAWLFP